MNPIDIAVARLEAKVDALETGLVNLNKLTDSVHTLALSVKELTTKQATMEQSITNLTIDMNEIKNRPTKRWDAVVASIISAFVGAVIAFVIK